MILRSKSVYAVTLTTPKRRPVIILAAVWILQYAVSRGELRATVVAKVMRGGVTVAAASTSYATY